MKHLFLILFFTGAICLGADKPSKRDSSCQLNVPSNVDSPRKRSKSVVERILGDQLISERESSPRSKDIFKIWHSKPNDPVQGVSATLCKVVRSKSVPQVEIEPPKDSCALTQEQHAATVPS